MKKGFEKRGEPMPEEWYKFPVYYKGNPASIIGPETVVAWPSFTEKFDYELELAIVITRKGATSLPGGRWSTSPVSR